MPPGHGRWTLTHPAIPGSRLRRTPPALEGDEQPAEGQESQEGPHGCPRPRCIGRGASGRGRCRTRVSWVMCLRCRRVVPINRYGNASQEAHIMGTDQLLAKDLNNPSYLELRLPPGTVVKYCGSLADEYDTLWTVQPCACRRCMRAVFDGRPATRYKLFSLNGEPLGPRHVRHTSVIPVLSDEENQHAGCFLATKFVSAYLRQELRRAFPGVKFSVRTGQGAKMWRISVRWADGPTETAVATVAAPLLATYGSSESRRPRDISVTVANVHRWGIPQVSAVDLDRV